MKGKAHGLSGAAGWLLVADTAQLVGRPLSLTATVAGTLSAAGWALWPDLDSQASAAYSLGWPTRALASGVAAVTGGHRKGAHYAISTAVMAALAWLLSAVPWVAFIVLTFGLAWAQAAFAADDRGRARLRLPLLAPLLWPRAVIRIAIAFILMRRVGPGVRWMFTVVAALAVLALDPTPTWLAGTVLVGGWAHLLGDMLTRDDFPVLRPFVHREFGGLGWIPPTPPGQRVTAQEWTMELALTLAIVASGLYLLTGGVLP